MSGRRSASISRLAAQLEALEGLGYQELRSEWRRLYRGDPPERLSRDVLWVGVAWKIQALVHGGVKPVTKRQLDALLRVRGAEPATGGVPAANDLPDAAPVAPGTEERRRYSLDRTSRLRPGTQLIREWNGETHTVVVLEDGSNGTVRSGDPSPADRPDD